MSNPAEEFDCNDCDLRKTCRKPVYGSGNGYIMFISDAPGETEDLSSIPFSGLSGRLLRESVGNNGNYLTYAVKCKPPEGRNITNEEIKACYHHLQEEIETVKPRLIIFIGKTAYSLHKKIYYSYNIPYLFFYHPSWAIRTLRAKQWSDEIGGIIRGIKEANNISININITINNNINNNINNVNNSISNITSKQK
ncbi:MAG: uracil-DNA glycosylase [Candidatus Micrarchaeaceae archaeon]